MVNQNGAPKKYPDKKWNYTSIFIPDDFQGLWEQFGRLARLDDDERFQRYCLQVEKTNLDKKGHGRTGIYLRWIIAQHVRSNAHKLQEEITA